MRVMKFILVFSFAFIAMCCVTESAQHDNTQVTPANTQTITSGNQVEEADTPKIRDKEWLLYAPTVVDLKGKLTIKTFFGPPNFGENPKTDTKDRCWILSLPKPINVLAKTDDDPTVGPSEENVREVQLILPEPHWELIGKNITVSGPLLHGHSGYHHLDVLMDVQSIRLSEGK